MRNGSTWYFAALFAYTLGCRLTPYMLKEWTGMSIDPATTWYPWNFSPLMAFALLGGATLKDSRWSLVLPLGVLLAGDLGIWLLTGDLSLVLYGAMPLVYGCYVVSAALGQLARTRPGILMAVPLGFVSEAIFFLVTNFAWWYGAEGPYPLTIAGLMASYVAALPFAARSFLSTMAFAIVLFSPAGLRLAGVETDSEEMAAAPAPVH